MFPVALGPLGIRLTTFMDRFRSSLYKAHDPIALGPLCIRLTIVYNIALGPLCIRLTTVIADTLWYRFVAHTH